MGPGTPLLHKVIIMKKFIILNICIIITAFAFVQGYVSVNSSAYAATGWENVTSTEELAEAFRYYCKSRDLTIDGSVADGVTKFTTQTFNNICNRLGLNVTAIQADLKKSTDGNLGVQYLFNSSGIATYNRIFAQFLQDNDLSVGDTVNDKDLYDGYIFNGSLCTVINQPLIGSYFGWHKLNEVVTSSASSTYRNYIESVGTPWVKDGGYDAYLFCINNGVTSSNTSVEYCRWVYNGDTYRIRLSREGLSGGLAYGYSSSPSSIPFYVTKGYSDTSSKGYNGYPSVFYVKQYADNGLFPYVFGAISHNENNDQYNCNFVSNGLSNNDTNIISVCNVNMTTNNNTINNNTYNENTYTTINNEGDVYNYDTDDEPEPGTPSTPSTPSPITPPSDSGGSDGDLTFPSFNFKFPEINWSLGDLSNKFPFSIPFDLVAFYTILNAEPRAPAVDAEIPLGDFYNWHFEADFSQFDSYAVIIRNVEYISFVVALIYITVKFVKG